MQPLSIFSSEFSQQRIRVPCSSSQHSSEHSQSCQLHPQGSSKSADSNEKSKACLDFFHFFGAYSL